MSSFGLQCLDGVGETYDGDLHSNFTEVEDYGRDSYEEQTKIKDINMSTNIETQSTCCCCGGKKTPWWKYCIALLAGVAIGHIYTDNRYKEKSNKKKKEEEED